MKGAIPTKESTKNRLKKAERTVSDPEEYAEIKALIRRGTYYDELTDEQKTQYCNYYGAHRKALEDIEQMVTGTFHFKLEPRKRPPTDAELEEIIKEVERIVDEERTKYNDQESPLEMD